MWMSHFVVHGGGANAKGGFDGVTEAAVGGGAVGVTGAAVDMAIVHWRIRIRRSFIRRLCGVPRRAFTVPMSPSGTERLSRDRLLQRSS